MFKKLFILAILIVIVGNLSAQWNQYSAVWEGKPGIMMVNMDLDKLAPSPDLGYLLEVSNLIYNCDEKGYPATSEIERVEDQFNKFREELVTKTYAEYAGRFIYQCEIRDYLYLNDTLGVNQLLETRKGINSKYQIKEDQEWKVYSNFIYPDDYLLQTITNGEIIKYVEEEGFDMNQKFLLTHFANFSDEASRSRYRTFLLEQNFKILLLSETSNADFPFQISFTRKDRLLIDQLSNITLRLHQRAEYLEGKYDGWEVEY